MTQTHPSGAMPEFSVHDRCRKAREFAGLDQDQLAARIDVSRGTISNYETGAVTKLKSLVLRQWAFACGVDYDWLRTGLVASGPDGLSDLGERSNACIAA